MFNTINILLDLFIYLDNNALIPFVLFEKTPKFMLLKLSNTVEL